MKKNFIITLFAVCISICTHAQPQIDKLNDLIEDIKQYQTTNTRFHSGNLYEHSLWVAITINEWFEQGEEWTHGLTEHDRKLATIGGLLHDVGKGGDLVFTYYTKPLHPEIGQQYLLGKKDYVFRNKKKFNFQACLNAMKLSDDDQKIVSILVGAHHTFGDMLQGLATIDISDAKNDKLRPYINEFKKRLRKFAQEADYKQAIDTRLIKLVLLVCAADVKGAQPCCCDHSFDVGGCSIATSPALVHALATDKFKEFGYETRGKIVKRIIEDFKE